MMEKVGSVKLVDYGPTACDTGTGWPVMGYFFPQLLTVVRSAARGSVVVYCKLFRIVHKGLK